MDKYIEKELDIMKDSASLILFNIRPIIIFVIFFAIFNLLGALSISHFCCYFTLTAAKKAYLDPDTLFTIMTNPICIIIFISSCIMFSFLAIFEISGIVHAYSMSFLNKKTSFRGMINSSINSSRKSLLPANWPIILFIIIIWYTY